MAAEFGLVISDSSGAPVDPDAQQGGGDGGGLGAKWGRIATGGMPGRCPEDSAAAEETKDGHLGVPKKARPGGMGRKKSSFLVTAERLAAKGETVDGLPPDQVIHGDSGSEGETDIEDLEEVYRVLSGGAAEGLPVSDFRAFLAAVGVSEERLQDPVGKLEEAGSHVSLDDFTRVVSLVAL
eukprot:TRINITY_DN30724_c0_g1_i1.p2 TRINITY_DN30724_c0_g1~~TRINITY_DN30724_c0_g1_i1.p2  ORF type:complete len:181 (+),score=49.83 TRINITY_DN30724_c0_g1_i1:89-631(+)